MRNINKMSTTFSSDIAGNVDLEIHGLYKDRMYSAEIMMNNYHERARRLTEYQIAYLQEHVQKGKTP